LMMMIMMMTILLKRLVKSNAADLHCLYSKLQSLFGYFLF
jgi:hypothetical protein